MLLFFGWCCCCCLRLLLPFVCKVVSFFNPVFQSWFTVSMGIIRFGKVLHAVFSYHFFKTAAVTLVSVCFALVWYSHFSLGFAEYSKVNKIYFVTHFGGFMFCCYWITLAVVCFCLFFFCCSFVISRCSTHECNINVEFVLCYVIHIKRSTCAIFTNHYFLVRVLIVQWFTFWSSLFCLYIDVCHTRFLYNNLL